MAKKLFAGVDAGGTKTDCIVVNENGQFLARATGKAGNTAVGRSSAIANIKQTLLQAAQLLDLAPDYETIFLGISGLNSRRDKILVEQQLRESFQDQDPRQAQISYQRLDAQNDIQALHAAAFRGRPGIVLICGTGSNCYGRAADGLEWQAGGLDYVFTDEGSAYDLALRAIKRILRGVDGREPPAPILSGVFCGQMQVDNYGEFSTWLHRDEASRYKNKIADLAPLVDAAIKLGCPHAQRVFEEAMDSLVELILAVARKLDWSLVEKQGIGITGGVVTHEIGNTILLERLRLKVDTANIFVPDLSPAAGAAIRALQLGGIEFTNEVEQTFYKAIVKQS